MRPAAIAAGLRRTNLMYREPALYDELMRGDDPVSAIVDQVEQFAPDAATVLDIGCGTGRALRELCGTRGLTGVGVDVQPELLTHAGRHPRCDWVAADARTVRLGRTFDLVMCLGNTAAYMHSADDLTALMATFAAHAHPGTLLLLMTMLGDGRAGESSSVRNTHLGGVKVYARSSWNSCDRMLSTSRRWEFADGRVEHDLLRRRCFTEQELSTGLAHAGFQVLAVGRPEDPLSVVAQYRGPVKKQLTCVRCRRSCARGSAMACTMWPKGCATRPGDPAPSLCWSCCDEDEQCDLVDAGCHTALMIRRHRR